MESLGGGPSSRGQGGDVCDVCQGVNSPEQISVWKIPHRKAMRRAHVTLWGRPTPAFCWEVTAGYGVGTEGRPNPWGLGARWSKDHELLLQVGGGGEAARAPTAWREEAGR